MSQYTGGITGPRVRQYLWFNPSAPKITRPRTTDLAAFDGRPVSVNNFPDEQSVKRFSFKMMNQQVRASQNLKKVTDRPPTEASYLPHEQDVFRHESVVNFVHSILDHAHKAQGCPTPRDLRSLELHARKHYHPVTQANAQSLWRKAFDISNRNRATANVDTVTFALLGEGMMATAVSCIELLSKMALSRRDEGLFDPSLLEAAWLPLHVSAEVSIALSKRVSAPDPAFFSKLVKKKELLTDLLTCGMLDLETAPLPHESKARIAATILCMTLSMDAWSVLEAVAPIDFFTPPSFENYTATRRGGTNLFLQAFNYLQVNDASSLLGPDYAPAVLTGAKPQGGFLMAEAAHVLFLNHSSTLMAFVPTMSHNWDVDLQTVRAPPYLSRIKNSPPSVLLPLSDSNIKALTLSLNRILTLEALYSARNSCFDVVTRAALSIPHHISSEFIASRCADGLKDNRRLLEDIFSVECMHQHPARPANTFLQIICFYFTDPRLGYAVSPILRDFYNILKGVPANRYSAGQRESAAILEVLLAPPAFKTFTAFAEIDRFAFRLRSTAEPLRDSIAAIPSDPFRAGHFTLFITSLMPFLRYTSSSFTALFRSTEQLFRTRRFDATEHAADALTLGGYLTVAYLPLPRLVSDFEKMFKLVMADPAFLPGTSLLVACYDFITEMQHLLLKWSVAYRRVRRRVSWDRRLSSYVGKFQVAAIPTRIRERKASLHINQADLKRFKAAVDAFRNKYSAVYG